MNYRNLGLLALVQGQACHVRIPGVCVNDSETVVPAHSNMLRHGKGRSLKAHDVFAVPACVACHMELDQGARLPREDRERLWMRAWEQWQLHLWQRGWIQVANAPAPRQVEYVPMPKIVPRRFT